MCFDTKKVSYYITAQQHLLHLRNSDEHRL